MLFFRRELLEHFLTKGHTVMIVAPCEGEEGLIEKLPIGIDYIPIKMIRTSKNPLSDFTLFTKLLIIFWKRKPDYIFNYTIKPNIYGSMAAKLVGIPCSSMIAGLGYTFTNNRLSSRIARLLYRIGMKCSQHLLLLNKDNLQTIKKARLCDNRKLILMKGGEGVNLDYYTFFDNRSDGVIFLFIARLIEEKGYNEFVKAAQHVKVLYPNTRFRVVGAFDIGYPTAITHEQVNADVRSGYIEYLGTTDNMLNYYKDPGIVVCIPSYYSEGLNRSLMEGCAVGKPIITTDHPGCRETVIDKKNGYMVPSKDVNALIEAMIRYIKLSPEEKNEMSNESRKHAVLNFDIKQVVQLYELLISK